MSSPTSQLESDTVVQFLSNQRVLPCANQLRTGYNFAWILYSQFALLLDIPLLSAIIYNGKTLVLECLVRSIRRRL